MSIDVTAVKAIDFHVHVKTTTDGHSELDQELLDAAGKYFQSAPKASVEDIVDYYRERQMAAVVFSVEAPAATGHPAIPSEAVAEASAPYLDTIIPFGSVDPHAGLTSIRRARRLVEDYGVKGFKFHPSLQDFIPNDRQFYRLWHEIESLGVPALFHTGQTGIGGGLPGGRGIKLRNSDPMLLDDVAADFPGLTIVLAHPSVPWQDSAISMATHKSNVYIDLSGWSPKYFPPQLVRNANSLLKRKVLFGTDFPLLTPDRWLADFEQLEFKDEVKPLLFKENAAHVLGLSVPS